MKNRASTAVFTQDIAYDRLAELLLAVTLLTDLATIVATTTRQSKYKALGLFIGFSTYFLLVFIAKCNGVSAGVSNVLGVVASFFWGLGGAAISYYEFSQFTAIVKSVRPSHHHLAEITRAIITLAVFIDGIFLTLDYLSPYVQLPAMFSSLVVVNLIQSAVCVPRVFSTFWILYVVKDIAKINDGVVRKLGMNYIGISGFQMMDGLIGLIIMFGDLGIDGRFVSLVGCIELILLHYAICRMLASEIVPQKHEEEVFKSRKETAHASTAKNLSTP
ncbi:hypothetical protein HDV04_002376 [Boothiomyces sp. JEL0838]|nr:hypothetical protein HDV04_002376 [Boothiomyces sp. JEL0838]